MLPLVALSGLGYGGVNPPTTQGVLAWFSGRFRGTAMGVKQTGFALGNALSAATLPAMALVMGWRAALAISCLGLFTSAALAALLYREAPRGAPPPAPRQPFRGTYRALLTNRRLLLLNFSGMLLSGSQLVVVTYLLLYLKETLALPVVVAGQALAVATLSGAVARVAWGTVSDRFAATRHLVLACIATLSALAMLLLSSLSSASPTWLAPLTGALIGATAIGWNAVYMVLLGELAGRRVVASATGLSVFFQFSAVIVGPPLFGLLVDSSSSYTLAWRLLAALNLANALLIATTGRRRAGVSG
jgi:nitrate/nitrite transporter NarK